MAEVLPEVDGAACQSVVCSAQGLEESQRKERSRGGWGWRWRWRGDRHCRAWNDKLVRHKTGLYWLVFHVQPVK